MGCSASSHVHQIEFKNNECQPMKENASEPLIKNSQDESQIQPQENKVNECAELEENLVDDHASSCSGNSSSIKDVAQINEEENQTVLNSLIEQNQPEVLVSIRFEKENDELEQPVITIEDVSKIYEENNKIEDPNMIQNEEKSSSVYDEILNEEHKHESNKRFGDDSTCDVIDEKCEVDNHLEENVHESKSEDIRMNTIESNKEDPIGKSTKDNDKESECVELEENLLDTSCSGENISSKEETVETYPEENQTVLNSLSEQNKPEILVTTRCELISDEPEQPTLTKEDISKTYEKNSNIEDPNLLMQIEDRRASDHGEVYNTTSVIDELKDHYEEGKNYSKLEEISVNKPDSNEENSNPN